MPIKTVKSTIDIEIQNENLDFFYLRNIELNEASMVPFRIMLLLDAAQFKEAVSVPLPMEWYQHMPWCVGVSICRNVFGHIYFVLKNKQGSVEFEISVDEIQSFYKTDELGLRDALRRGILVNSLVKTINIAGTMLVTDQTEYIILVGDGGLGGITSVFLNSEPFSIVDIDTSDKTTYSNAVSRLPLTLRGVYEKEEEE